MGGLKGSLPLPETNTLLPSLQLLLSSSSDFKTNILLFHRFTEKYYKH